MAETTFKFIGDVAVEITVTEVDGNLVFTVEVLDETGQIGDLRGLFFDLDDDSLTGLKIFGVDVTSQETNTKDLGQGNNMNGGGRGNYDVGVGFGTPGIGQDDIQTTTFTLSADQDLSLDDLAENFGVRLTSVGEEGGPRNGSLKLTEVCEDECCEEVCEEEQVCTEITIDFNEQSAGAVVSQYVFDDLIVDIDAQRKNSGPANDAMIFDTANPTGGDDDLATDEQEMVLIITEDNDATDPDDAGQGGYITFKFNEAVDMTSIVVIDANGGGTIVSDQGDSVDIPDQEDGQIGIIDLSGFDDITELTVNLTGSGAVDDLIFEECDTIEFCRCVDDLL